VNGSLTPIEREAMRRSFSMISTAPEFLVWMESEIVSIKLGLRPMGSALKRLSEAPIHQRKLALIIAISVATADGSFNQQKIERLGFIAQRLGFTNSDIQRVLADMGQGSDPKKQDEIRESFETLGLLPDATRESVRSAFRQLAQENHPDKFERLGPKMVNIAKERMIKINVAYQVVCEYQNRIETHVPLATSQKTAMLPMHTLLSHLLNDHQIQKTDLPHMRTQDEGNHLVDLVGDIYLLV